MWPRVEPGARNAANCHMVLLLCRCFFVYLSQLSLYFGVRYFDGMGTVPAVASSLGAALPELYSSAEEIGCKLLISCSRQFSLTCAGSYQSSLFSGLDYLSFVLMLPLANELIRLYLPR